MLIQVVLIAVVLGVLFVLLRSRGAPRARAWTRLLMLGLVAVAIGSVLRPDLTTRVAQFFGVGRGTDLLLYLLTAVFVYVVLIIYLKFRDLETRVTALNRRLAIDEALRDGSLWPNDE